MNRFRIHALLGFCLFAAHLVLQRGMHYPSAFYDELLYLGAGRFFAGAGPMPNMYNGVWGHLGYAAALAPAFRLFRDFPHQYRAVLVVNAALMTSTYPLLYLILKRFQREPSRWLSAIAFTASLYPSFLIFSNFAISENLFTPLFLLVFLLWLRFLERPGIGRSVAAGMSVLGLYLVHNRAVSVAISSILFALVLCCLRRVPWKSGLVVAGIGIGGLLLVEFLKHYLEANWPPTVFPAANFPKITSIAGLETFLLICFGQLVYLVSSTFGLYLGGVGYLTGSVTGSGTRMSDRTSPDRPPQTNRTAVAFLLVVHAAVFIGSAAFMVALDPLSRPDYILMGRYNEGLLPVFLGAGLLLLFEAGASVRLRKVLIICSGSSVAILAAGIVFLQSLINWPWLNGPTPRINFLSFMPLYRALRVNSMAALLSVPIAIAAIAVTASLLRRAPAVTVLIAILFGAEAAVYVSTDIRAMENLSLYDAATGSASHLGAMLAASPIAGPVDVERNVWDSFYFSQWQLYCGDRSFRVFIGPTAKTTAGKLVIARKKWRGAEEAGYRNSGCEEDQSACLWIR